MANKRLIEDLEIGDQVILPSDVDREWRSVVSTEMRALRYHISVRGIIKPYVGCEGEEIPYREPVPE